MTTYASGTALVRRIGDIPISPMDGAAHLFVNPVSGNDRNAGLSPDDAFQTINAALKRANELLELQFDFDVVVELANGTYAEDVRVIPVGLRRRLIIRGDVTAMTVMASGTAGVGTTAATVVDAAAAFGDIDGLVLTAFDPASPATTQQWITIRSHTATSIQPGIAFFPVPVPGVWTYQVLRPAVKIIGGLPLPSSANIQFAVIQPAISFGQSGGNVQTFKLPSVIVAWIETGNPAFPLQQGFFAEGGLIDWVGCVYEGAGLGVTGEGCGAFFGALFSIEADPVFGLPAGDLQTLAGASLGIRTTFPFTGSRFSNSALFGFAVFFRGGLGLSDNCDTFFIGGSIQGPSGLGLFASQISLLIDGFDPALTFLITGVTAGAAIHLDDESAGEIGGGVEFLTNSGDLVFCDSQSFAHLFFPITADAVAFGFFAAFAVDRAGIQAALGVAYPAPLSPIRADATVGSWLALLVGVPLIGLNSDARIWRF